MLSVTDDSRGARGDISDMAFRAWNS